MKQIVILADDEHSNGDGGMADMGSRSDVLSQLATRNTGPAENGDDVLYGPGFRIELAPEQDPVTQMLLTVDDEDIAWTVIMRIAKDLDWKLLDPMTGRELRPR